MQIIRLLSLISIYLLIAINSKSQDWNTIFTLETDAEYYMADGNFNKAADTYLKALKHFPESANLMFKAGYCFLKTDDQKKEALYYLEEAAKKVSDKYDERSLKEPNAPPEVLYNLGVAYLQNMEFDKAIAAFEEFKKYVKSKDAIILDLVAQHIQSCKVAKTFINNPIGLNSKDFDANINTDQSNFDATVSGDGKTMAYTTRSSTGNKIYISKLDNGEWGKPQEITRYLGSKFLTTSYISYEGKELYLIEEDPKNSDIVVSFLEKNKWSKIVKAAKPINSKFNESHVCVSNDGNTVYFTSDRKGGQGGFDIYKTTVADGRWSEPVNLGPNINTPLNEATPFLTPDEKYLFFSSEGHNTMGGYDIFYVNLDETSTVTNVGYPLNTTDDNVFFQPTGLNSGYYSYFDPAGKGGLDIHFVEITPLVDLNISIMLAENAPTDKDYSVSITDQSNKTIENLTERGISQVNKKVIPGKYQVLISGKDFEAISNTIEIPSDIQTNNFKTSVTLNPIKQVEPVMVAQVPEQKQEIEQKQQQQTPVKEIVEPQKEEIPVKKKVKKEETKEIKKNREIKKTEDKPVKAKPPVPENAAKPIPVMDFKKSNISTAAVAISYSVQLMAAKHPADISYVNKLDSVSVTISPDGYYRYSVGNSSTIQESENILAQLKAKGYNNAYVRINREHPGFTIQIVALTKPKSLNQFSNINDIMVYRGSDGIYRYCIGKYSSPEEAQEDLTKLSAMGYNGAFVRTLGK